MTKLLNEVYIEQHNNLINTIKNCNFVSITTNLWSNKNNQKSFLRLINRILLKFTFYYSLTLHYINDDFQRQFAISATTLIEGSHNATNISNIILKELEELKINLKKVHVIIRDAAVVMRKATINLNINLFDCMIHKIHLVRSTN